MGVVLEYHGMIQYTNYHRLHVSRHCDWFVVAVRSIISIECPEHIVQNQE